MVVGDSLGRSPWSGRNVSSSPTQVMLSLATNPAMTELGSTQDGRRVGVSASLVEGIYRYCRNGEMCAVKDVSYSAVSLEH